MKRETALKVAKPILFNTKMVRAIQGSRKTATRRVVKLQPESKNDIIYKHPEYEKRFISPDDDNVPETEIKPTYKVGDILYVRETWAAWSRTEGIAPMLHYKADGEDLPGVKWHPSIHMPKEAARIFLRVKKISVERLQDSFFKSGSTIFTLLGEGVDIGKQCRECIDTYGSPCCIDDESECGTLDEARSDYSDLWNNTIKKSDLAKYGWAANPCVWVIELERVEVET